LPLTNPWPLLIAALVTEGLALVLQSVAGQLVVMRCWLIAAGVIMGLGAVAIRLRTVQEDVDDRFRTAGILALAAGVPFLGGYALNLPEWDSAGLLLSVFVGVGLVSATLLLLPRLIRRIVLTLLVLIHFGGILSSVGSPAPPNGVPSWLVNQLWVGLYRPYLNFMYLNNAYHFYSPEPGPPMLLWFRIEYKGGKSRWVEVPNLQEAHSKLGFLRQLALTESTNNLNYQAPRDFELRLQRRFDAGRRFQDGPVPMLDVPGAPRNNEYREPQPYSKLMIRSYARYVARHYPCEEDPDLKVKSVKVYRIMHEIPTPGQLAEGARGPYDPTTYLPYYQGEFDAQGKLLDGPKFDKQGNPIDAGSPFLYWLIPIKWEPKPDVAQPRWPVDYQIVDYLKLHAGDAGKPSFWEEKK
jgi:hypothetical protein